MSWSITKQWIDWCYGDTSRATENDWNRFVQETYDAWAKDKSGHDEILNELEGNEWDAYYEEHYSREVFFEISEENEELSLILNGHFNLASVSWYVGSVISFSTESFSGDDINPDCCEKVSLQHLRNFYLMERLKTDKPNELGTWGRDDQSDPDNEIRKLLAFYLKYREEVEDIHEE